VLLLFLAAATPAFPGEKPSANDVIAKSAEAFAPADLRVPAQGRELECRATWRIVVGGSGGLQGECLLQSRDKKFHLNSDFHNSAYPGEDILYTGEGSPIIRQLSPGKRSVLGSFIYSNLAIVRSGVFGGVLTTAWPLFNFEKSGAKLTSHGTRKVDGQKLNEFEYQGPGQGETKIFLYFDPETSGHVMTEYRALTPAFHTGDITHPSGKDVTTILQEKFSEFRQVYGMTIPLVWTIRFSQEEGAIQEWQFTFTKQKLMVPDEAFAHK
jgi:hypothetical protein